MKVPFTKKIVCTIYKCQYYKRKRKADFGPEKIAVKGILETVDKI